jgi:hypothetical protein
MVHRARPSRFTHRATQAALGARRSEIARTSRTRHEREGIVSQGDVDSGNFRIIASAGFLRATMSENVRAGISMSRRSRWGFGTLLHGDSPDPRDPSGNAGIGPCIPVAVPALW